ncbi:MAG: histidine kinase, partial [Pyrinomonadaceae bacterium]|nr:histidine kinase [Phycisphaerales bacterium]
QPQLAEAQLAVARLTDQVRTLSVNLRPQVLDDLGLLPALRWHVDQFRRRTRVRVSLTTNLESSEKIPPLAALTVYRVTQEALTNVARHSRATWVQIRLKATAAELSLSITDNGSGFLLERMHENVSTGVSGMRERIHMLDGNFSIQSAPESGTRIRCLIPLAPEKSPSLMRPRKVDPGSRS